MSVSMFTISTEYIFCYIMIYIYIYIAIYCKFPPGFFHTFRRRHVWLSTRDPLSEERRLLFIPRSTTFSSLPKLNAAVRCPCLACATFDCPLDAWISFFSALPFICSRLPAWFPLRGVKTPVRGGRFSSKQGNNRHRPWLPSFTQQQPPT